MFNEIDFSKIDTGITPPQDGYRASVLLYGEAGGDGGFEGAGAGTADYLLSADVWVSDE